MKTIFSLSAFLFTAILFSQNSSAIKGSVTDKAMNNEPMLFANIELKDSDINYQTNFHGNFEILDISPGSHTLIISYAGYQTEELTVVVQKNSIFQIETALAPKQINFDDVFGMDAVSKQEAVFPTDMEKSSKK